MNSMKKMTALLLAAAMMLPAVACANIESSDLNAEYTGDPDGSGNAEESGNSDSDASQENSGADNSSADNSSADNSSSANDNGNSSNDSAMQILQQGVVTDQYGQQNQSLVFDQPKEAPVVDDDGSTVVTTIRGTDGNYYAPVTDINGATVTEPSGEVKTELYTGTTNAASYPDISYQPDFKTYQALWMDISQKADFVFDGNLLEFEIEVPETTQDGVYPIEIYYTDFSNYNADSLKDIAVNAGYVCVNSEEPAPSSPVDGQITLTPDTVSAKPGDTVRLNVRIDNNTGIVAFVIRMHYDANAMTITKAAAGSDLGRRAQLTTRTLDAEEDET